MRCKISGPGSAVRRPAAAWIRVSTYSYYVVRARWVAGRVACSGNERRGGWPPPQPGSAGRCFGGTVKRTGIGQEYDDFGGVSVKLQYLVPFLSRNFNGAVTFLLYRTVHVKGGDTVTPLPEARKQVNLGAKKGSARARGAELLVIDRMTRSLACGVAVDCY